MNNKHSLEDWFPPGTTPKNPRKRNCKLFPFQKEKANSIFYHLYCLDHPSRAVNGGVGIGKTYVIGELIDMFLEAEILKSLEPQGIYALCPTPIMYVTKASILEQTRRVLTEKFSISTIHDILLTNYDQLRAEFGKLYISREIKIDQGVEYEVFKWQPLHPWLIIWDECHALKNEDSLQSLVGQAANEIVHPGLRQIFMSATLFTKVAEAKCFAVSTKLKIGDY